MVSLTDKQAALAQRLENAFDIPETGYICLSSALELGGQK